MRNLTDSELTQIELPKWPQMIVTGKAVTTDQACEIIRKTDLFFEIFAGNNQEELDLLSRRLRIPCLSQLVFPRDIFKLYGSRETWRSVWGSLPTSYVQNSWISDNGPPYGWCRPDGKIQYTGNIGKWPEIEEVVEDWRRLANGFPYLHLVATLMSGGSWEDSTRPLLSILVEAGHIQTVTGSLEFHPDREQVQTEAQAEAQAEASEGWRGDGLLYGSKAYWHTLYTSDRSALNRRIPAVIPEEWIALWEQRAIGLFGSG